LDLEIEKESPAARLPLLLLVLPSILSRVAEILLLVLPAEWSNLRLLDLEVEGESTARLPPLLLVLPSILVRVAAVLLLVLPEERSSLSPPLTLICDKVK